MNRSKNLFIPNICKKLLQVGKFETVSDVQSNIISEPTHFTESLFSLIDLLLVTNKNKILLGGVGKPFLDQNIKFHCPKYCVLIA